MHRCLLLLLFCFFELSVSSGQCTFIPVDTSGNECFNARFMCGTELNGYSSTLSTMTTGGNQPPNFCGSSSAENIEWFSFLVSEPNVRIEIVYTNCMDGTDFDQGFQSGVYSGCDFANDDIICVSSNIASGVTTLVFATTPGIHYLFVDGFAGSVCDFTINVIAGVCNSPFDMPNMADNICRPVDLLMQDADTVIICKGTESIIRPDLDLPPVFSFCGVDDSLFNSIINGNPFFCIETYMNLPSGYTYVSGNTQQIFYTTPSSTSFDEAMTIRWDEVGTYEVRQRIFVNPYLPHCLDFDTLCSEALIVEVVPYDSLVLMTDTVCIGDLHIFVGQNILINNDTLLIDEDIANCIYTEQFIKALPVTTVDLGTVYYCDNNCFTINGNDYCSPGSFIDQKSGLCDTIFEFDLEELQLELNISGDTIITCTNNSVTLTASATTNFVGNINYIWKNSLDQQVGDMAIFMTSATGLYTLEAVAEGYPQCMATATVTVFPNDNLPMLDFTIPELSCNVTSGTIIPTSNMTISTFQWSGSAGILSTDPQYMVTDTGTYTLSILAANGCFKDTTFQVIGDFEEPNYTLNYFNINCFRSIYTAAFLSNETASHEWEFPDMSVSTSNPIMYTEAGTYTLSITGNNGCMSDTTYTIVDLSNVPSVGMDKDTIWRCNTTDLVIIPDIPATYTIAWSTTDGNFDILGDTLLVSSIGTYIINMVDTETGCPGSDTLRVIDDPIVLDALATGSNPLCPEAVDGTIFFNISTGHPPYTVTLNGQDLNSEMLPAGNYDIVLEDVFGCSFDTTIVLTDPPAFEVITECDVIYSQGQTLELEATANIGDDAINDFFWSNKLGDELGNGPILNINSLPDSSIFVIVVDTNGCQAMKTINFTFDNTKMIHAPTIFSPNGDGNNDTWIIKSGSQPTTMDKLSIYDRWGNVMYQRENVSYNEESEGWDGKYNGVPVQSGVYVYKAVYKDISGQKLEKAGTITLVR